MITADRFVTHTSTVPATRGQSVGLFLREKVLESTLAAEEKPQVVLMVHGGFAPGPIAYDLQYGDYSFMAALAGAGFDVFALSHTGYGPSPRPLMDDPCNVDRGFQAQLIPHVLQDVAPPRWPHKLVSSRTEWDELETVIRFLKALRGVERVSLVGWSTGAPRAGGFAALHPDEVDKLVFFGPSALFPVDEAPAETPEPGAPVILQSRDFLLHNRWQDHVRCPGQIEDLEVCEALWRELMALDEVGARWSRHGQGIMRAPNRTNFGWRKNLGLIKAPTLVLLGDFDNYDARLEAWRELKVEHRMFIRVACTSHFMQFERGRHLLYRATARWLKSGAVDGEARGEFAADEAGRIEPRAAALSD